MAHINITKGEVQDFVEALDKLSREHAIVIDGQFALRGLHEWEKSGVDHYVNDGKAIEWMYEPRKVTRHA